MHTELGIVRLANRDGARCAKAAHDHGVLGRVEVAEGNGAVGCGHSTHPDDVLDRERAPV
jgi:hypothetical protein